jgi:hypothetical protein
MSIRTRVSAAAAALALFAAAPAAAEPLKSGAFGKQEQRISGTWSIEQAADGAYLVLSSDFTTRSAPDLKLFLNPLPPAQVTAQNATQGVLIGPLKSAKGASRYKLPAGLDLGRYKSVVLHCEQYTKLWGAGEIR